MYHFLHRLFFSLTILLLSSFKLYAEDELLSGNSYLQLQQPYVTELGELRIGFFNPYNMNISTDEDLLNVVSQHLDATGFRLSLCTNSQKAKITWETGIKAALLSMPNVKTLTYEFETPEDFFLNINRPENCSATFKISTFQAYGCQYNEKIDLAKILEGFQELEKLVLYSCDFVGLTPTLNLNVRDLRLWDCSIKDSDLTMFASSLPNLKSLRIAECNFYNKNTENKFTNNTIDILSRFQHLEELSFLTSSDGCFISSDYPKNMYPVSLANNHRYVEISDSVMATFRISMPQLHCLRLGKLRKVGNEGIFQLSDNLKILHLEGLSNKFTDKGFRHIINSLTKLEELTIGGYRSCDFRHTGWFECHYIPLYCQISKEVFKECKNVNLKKLHLLYCENVNDNSLIDLVYALPNIKELTLTNCLNISDNGLETLRKLKPKIKIDVSNQSLGLYKQFPDD